jgi:hypothetical protein
VLVTEGRAFYLGPKALPAEQAALRGALAGADDRFLEYVRGDRAYKKPLVEDGVVALVYPVEGYQFVTEAGFVRVQRAATSRGVFYWASVERGRWTHFDGPLAGAEIDAAWDGLARAAQASGGRVLDPSPFFGGQPMVTYPDGITYVRAMLADLPITGR